MKVQVLGYNSPFEFDGVDEIRWSTNAFGRDPYADRGKRALYLEPGTEFVIDNRGETQAQAATAAAQVSDPVVIWQGKLYDKMPPCRVVRTPEGIKAERMYGEDATGNARWDQFLPTSENLLVEGLLSAVIGQTHGQA